MNYITHKRFKGLSISGDVNLPAMTDCSEAGNVIYYNGNAICASTSHIAHQYFARNDDGNGMLRGKLTQSIQNTLNTRDGSYQDRWDKVWSDPVCQKYKRKEHADHWLWNHDFYNADILTLKHIAHIVGVKEG